jgi:hypothetical protein
MTRRALQIELLRGAAPVTVAGVLVGGGVTLLSLAGDWAGWAGRWMPFAASVRMSLFVIGAITVACAAWQGGLEHRRRLGDQLDSTARPRWQPVLLSWAAVTLGATVALLVLVLAGAALVAPVASYAGGGWWWVLAVSVPGMAALSALGFAAGRLVPSRLTAPVVGIGTYLLMVGAIDTAGLNVRWLAPVLSQYDAPGYLLSDALSAKQTLWFGGLAAAALVLVAARRRWLAVIPAAVAVAAGFALVSDPVESWRPDPAAAEPVCADGAPHVCVSRLNAFVLDEVTTAVQPVLARWDGVPGPQPRTDDGVIRMVGHAIRGYVEEPQGDRVLEVRFDAGMTLTGRMAEPYEGTSLVSWWPTVGCDDDATYGRHGMVLEVTSAWGSGAASSSWMEADRLAALETLDAMPADAQRVWFTAAIEAARTCDEAVLTELAEQLR